MYAIRSYYDIVVGTGVGQSLAQAADVHVHGTLFHVLLDNLNELLAVFVGFTDTDTDYIVITSYSIHYTKLYD